MFDHGFPRSRFTGALYMLTGPGPRMELRMVTSTFVAAASGAFCIAFAGFYRAMSRRERACGPCRAEFRTDGWTPPAQRAGTPSPAFAKLASHEWKQHCRGLFQTPIPA